VGFFWFFCGIFLVILWDFSGYFVGFFWLFCGIFLVILWDFSGYFRKSDRIAPGQYRSTVGFPIDLKFGIHVIYIVLHMYIVFQVNRTPDHRRATTRSNSVRFAEITRKIPQKNQKNPTKEPEKSHGHVHDPPA